MMSSCCALEDREEVLCAGLTLPLGYLRRKVHASEAFVEERGDVALVGVVAEA